MKYIAGEYDVAVVGLGHAGCEAGLACARLGLSTVCFSINLDSIANMPCNPNIGGTAKGQLVREIDALGGEMGKNADKTLIQSKILNSSKGPAVYSLRAQIDRRQYQIEMKKTLEQQENLDVIQSEVTEILLDEENHKVKGLVTHTGRIFLCKAIVLTTGTYLKSSIIIGDVSYSSGPDGLFPANKLSDSLKDLGINLMRLKTGTPARVNRRSVDFSQMEEQKGDETIVPFSFETENIDIDQVSCYLTHTNSKTHEIIKDNIHRSPLYSGLIEGIGPRYCPSIEDKIVRFADKESHQVFVEPMGLNTEECYLQGLSTSLPEDVQADMVHSVSGLENAQIMRSAYAIEYDAIDATQLKLSLELRDIDGLFCAGQINGSSGYEEAAAQGLIAGINAARKIKNKEPIIIDRSQGYIGVLIDDLVTKGTKEPYRMMTSRAEYRLLLRQDNADLRLTHLGHEIGLISDERYNAFLEKKERIDKEIERVKKFILSPTEELNVFLAERNSSLVKTGVKMHDLIRRPEIDYDSLEQFDPNRPTDLSFQVKEQVNISIKYEGYIKRQEQQVSQFKKLENKKLPEDLDYEEIHGLRLEARQKLNLQKPHSVGQASRITGVSPADISVLLIYLSQHKNV